MSSTICYGCHKNESKASTFTKTYFYNYPLFSIYNNFTISRNGMMTHATLDIIKTLQLDKIVNCKEILNPSLILFIYLYAACGCLAAAFPVGMAVLLMKCPCYQYVHWYARFCRPRFAPFCKRVSRLEQTACYGV